MALRTKTIVYSFTSSTAFTGSGSRTSFSSQTLYIPETSARLFTSVKLEISCRDGQNTAATTTARTLGIQLGAAGTNDDATTLSITNSGEHQSYILHRDCTDYFNQSFGTGSSQTCVASVIVTGLTTTNFTALLFITYQFDDSGHDTRVKTVAVPFDHSVTTLTSTLAATGTQVPQLTGAGGMLPEANITIRDIFFLMESNESSTAASNFLLGMSLDAGVEEQDTTHDQTLNSSVFYRWVWKKASMTTTSSHTLEMRTTVTARMCWPSVVMYVTYEYTVTGSSRYLNSRVMPFGITGPLQTSNLGSDYYSTRFNVDEPGAITLRQSGIKVYVDASTASNLSIKVGPQAYTTYIHTAGTITCGAFALTHRFDSGAVAGLGTTLTSGTNHIAIYAYTGSLSQLGFTSGYIYLNYESGIDNQGPDTHAHSTCWIGRKHSTSENHLVASGVRNVAIPETYYRLEHTGYDGFYFSSNFGNSMTMAVSSGVGTGAFRSILADTRQSDGQMSVSFFAADATRLFKKTNVDTGKELLDIEVPRDVKFYSNQPCIKSWSQWITYSSMTYCVSGTLSDYTGDGSGVRVDIFTPEREYVTSAQTNVSATYSGTVYDKRSGYFSAARQSSTHTGRSDDGFPA